MSPPSWKSYLQKTLLSRSGWHGQFTVVCSCQPLVDTHFIFYPAVACPCQLQLDGAFQRELLPIKWNIYIFVAPRFILYYLSRFFVKFSTFHSSSLVFKPRKNLKKSVTKQMCRQMCRAVTRSGYCNLFFIIILIVFVISSFWFFVILKISKQLIRAHKNTTMKHKIWLFSKPTTYDRYILERDIEIIAFNFDIFDCTLPSKCYL